MRRLASVFLLTTTLALGGCYHLEPVQPPPPRALRSPQPIDWRALVGCYRMEALKSFQAFPFALDSVQATRPSGQIREGAMRARAPYSGEPEVFWRVSSENTLHLSLQGTGIGGQFYELIPRGERLEGRYWIWIHSGHLYWHSGAAAQRVPCAEAPPADSAARP